MCKYRSWISTVQYTWERVNNTFDVATCVCIVRHCPLKYWSTLLEHNTDGLSGLHTEVGGGTWMLGFPPSRQIPPIEIWLPRTQALSGRQKERAWYPLFAHALNFPDTLGNRKLLSTVGYTTQWQSYRLNVFYSWIWRFFLKYVKDFVKIY